MAPDYFLVPHLSTQHLSLFLASPLSPLMSLLVTPLLAFLFAFVFSFPVPLSCILFLVLVARVHPRLFYVLSLEIKQPERADDCRAYVHLCDSMGV